MDMKKVFYIVAVALLALGAVSCKKDNVKNNEAGYGVDGKWRIPTEYDWSALLGLKGNEDYKWDDWVSVPDDKGNEIFGMRVTRISTGATLFFPAAGDCYDA